MRMASFFSLCKAETSVCQVSGCGTEASGEVNVEVNVEQLKGISGPGGHVRLDGASSPSGRGRHIAASDVDVAMEEVAASVRPWDPADFKCLRTLQEESPGGFGRVEAALSHRHMGRSVAVKRLPNRWMASGPRAFAEQHPGAVERPWQDLAIMRQLGRVGFPHACELLGVFNDEEDTYIVTSLAADGNLLSWCTSAPAPGPAREAAAQPLATQIFSAVRQLHDLGLAHRDLSLESLQLTDGSCGQLRVLLTDFGVATPYRLCQREVRGKAAYVAPEMYADSEYDAFATDAFALGVALFAMVAYDYPWRSTMHDDCRLYEYASVFGVRKLMQKRKLRNSTGTHLADVLSPALVEVVAGLLEADPVDRLGLGEACCSLDRRSIWKMKWLEACAGAPAQGPEARSRLGGA